MFTLLISTCSFDVLGAAKFPYHGGRDQYDGVPDVVGGGHGLPGQGAGLHLGLLCHVCLKRTPPAVWHLCCEGDDPTGAKSTIFHICLPEEVNHSKLLIENQFSLYSSSY